MTTAMTQAHDSATCSLGVDGSRCHECDYQHRRAQLRTREAMLHDPLTCTTGTEDKPCLMCEWAEKQKRREQMQEKIATVISDNNFNHWQRQLAASAEQSTADLRRRQAALLERPAPELPTEGADALAAAYLAHEPWFTALDNNAMEDEARLALAQAIDRVVETWLESRRQACERVLRMKGEG